jgi:hypothetical protein
MKWTFSMNNKSLAMSFAAKLTTVDFRWASE